MIQPDGMRVEIAVMSVSWVFCLDGMQLYGKKNIQKNAVIGAFHDASPDGIYHKLITYYIIHSNNPCLFQWFFLI